MKITFKITQKTTLAPGAIIGRIVATLDKLKYRVNNVTESCIEFDEEPWKLMWNFQAVRRLDGGKFEIAVLENEVLVTFSWYKSLLMPALMVAAASAWLIWNGEYYAPLFFIAFYFIAITINIVMLRSIARGMLSEITA